MEEQTLTRQVTKAGFASLTSRFIWRRLAQGIAIMFLLTQPAWAGIGCHCQHENEAQQVSQMAHACCPTGHHSGHAVGTEHASEATNSPASCSEEGEISSDDQLGTTMVCCHATPQSEAQGVTIPSQDPVPVINAQPLVCPGAPAVSTPTYHNFHQLNRTRPLYLSFSCFLI